MSVFLTLQCPSHQQVKVLYMAEEPPSAAQVLQATLEHHSSVKARPSVKMNPYLFRFESQNLWKNTTERIATPAPIVFRNTTQRTRCTDRRVRGVCCVWQFDRRLPTANQKTESRRTWQEIRKAATCWVYIASNGNVGAPFHCGIAQWCFCGSAASTEEKLDRTNTPPSARWKRPSTRLTTGNVRSSQKQTRDLFTLQRPRRWTNVNVICHLATKPLLLASRWCYR